MPDGKAARLLTKLLGKLPHPRAYTDTATDPRGATITQHARPGVSLRAHARELEYHLATCGYALTRPVALVAADTERPVLAGDTLSLPLAALGASGLRLRWLYFDVPRVLIFGPRVSWHAPAGPEASLAAYVLTIGAIASADTLRAWLSAAEAESLAPLLQTIGAAELLEAVLARQDLGDLAVSRAAVHKCLQAVRLRDHELAVRPEEGRGLPTLAVTPDTLTRWEIPPVAVSWLADRYGWTRTEAGRTEGRLLPLQVLGIAQGICGRLLTRSGIVAAPTSAGKTLLAEVRMLARYFAPRGRRKTIMLVPTREVGLERYDVLMAAYGVGERTRNPERRMNICYSDGEHHGDDRNIWEGRFDLAILINEKFQFFQQNKRFLNGVGEVVFDELEVLADETRGTYLEMALTSAASHHRDLTVLGLSRPAQHFDALMALLRSHGRDPFVLEVERRPVPVEVGLWAGGRAVYRNCNTARLSVATCELGYPRKKKQTLRRLLELFLRQTPGERKAGLRNNLVLAAPTKRKNLELAGILEGLFQTDRPVRAMLSANMNTALLSQRLRALEPTQRKALLERLLPIGIGLHDADMTVEERRLVSHAFRDGELAVLVCTQTFAYGVNLPAQTIVFIDWGTAPGLNGEFPPYYVGLTDYFEAWLGRVGRYGLGTHRLARALYLCRGWPGSDEWNTMRQVIEAEKDHLVTHLERAATLAPAVLYAIRSLRHAQAEYPTWAQLDAFLQRAPSMHERPLSLSSGFLKETRRLGMLDFHKSYYDLFYAANRLVQTLDDEDHDRAFEAVESACQGVIATAPGKDVEEALQGLLHLCRADETGPLVDYVTTTGFAGRMLVEPDEAIETRGLRLCGGRLELTRLGAIACAHGVLLETCLHFYRWLEAHEGKPCAWDLIDLLVLVRTSSDGRRIPLMRVSPAIRVEVEAAFEAHVAQAARRMDAAWQARSLVTDKAVKGYRRKATLLALRDWRAGIVLHSDAGDDIETTYGLFAHGSNLYRHARDYARLVRVLSDVAGAFPEGTFPPERPATIADDAICVPYDLDRLSVELQYGMPQAAGDLAALSIEGLSRTWVLKLYAAVEARMIDPDLPLLDRVRALADDEAAFQEAFATPGLAARVKTALEERPRMALAEGLRGDEQHVKAFYAHPAVIKAQLLQGFERYTALRVRHRRIYTVFRRNVVKGDPIMLEKAGDVTDWVERGAVEFLAEIGQVRTDGFMVDRLFVDLDPKNDYPLARLTHVAATLARQFAQHRWVDPDRVFVHWTGGEGFHVVGYMKADTFRPVETVKIETRRLLLHLCDDVEIFLDEHAAILTPYVVLDLAPVKARGVYRNAFSIHANAGGVCVPVAPDHLDAFDPATEAAPAVVMARLDGLEAAASYRELAAQYFGRSSHAQEGS